MSDADGLPASSEPSGGDMEKPEREGDGVPPEALEPSGRSEESLPTLAPNPSRRSMEADPDDGSTEIPPVSPDA